MNAGDNSEGGKTDQHVERSPNTVKALEILSSEVEALWIPRKIPKLSSEPTPIEFLREYVSRSVPCIIPYNQSACVGLTLDDLIDLSGNSEVTVDVTPDGHGDCVRPVQVCDDGKLRTVNMFVQPEEQVMSLEEFRTKLRQSRKLSVWPEYSDTGKKNLINVTLETGDEAKEFDQSSDEVANKMTASIPPVYYYSRQNDCLRTELQNIFDNSVLFPKTIPFAEEAFNTPLEAVNLWVGDERAVSSMHKDHYENLFLVLSGEKVFTICPPSDMAFLYEKDFDSSRFHCKDNHEWVVRVDNLDPSDNESREKSVGQRVKWIEPDVTEPTDFNDKKRYPLLHNAHPIEVRVKEGEMLYLPSLWFHRVTQSCETVGINYLFDMRFDDPKWCYFHFLKNLFDNGENTGS